MRKNRRPQGRRGAGRRTAVVFAVLAIAVVALVGAGLALDAGADGDGAAGGLAAQVASLLGSDEQVGAEAEDDAEYVLENAGALAYAAAYEEGTESTAGADGEEDSGGTGGSGGAESTVVTDEDGAAAAAPSDYVAVTYTFADGELLDEQTIDELWDDSGVYEGAYLAQFTSYTALYDLDEASDYYVGRVNASVEYFTVTDWAATENNDYAVPRDDVVYDQYTGLVYVPKSYLKTASEYEGEDYETADYEDYLVCGSTRLQLLFCSTGTLEEALGATVTFDYSLTSTGVAGVVSDGAVTASIFDTAVYVDLTDGSAVSADDVVSVTVNGVTYDADSGVWDVDDQTGQLAVAFYPAAVRSLEVVLDGTVSASEVAAAAVRLLTGAAVASAATSSAAESSTWTDASKWSSTIPAADEVGIEFENVPKAGTLFSVSGFTKYCTNWREYLEDTDYILAAIPEFSSNQHSDSRWTGNLIDLVTEWSTYHNKRAYYVDYSAVHLPSETQINNPYLRAKLSKGTYESTAGSSNTLTISDSAIYLLLSCAHNTDAVDDETDTTATALLRILAVDTTSQQVIVGVATHSVYTQAGAGILRLSYENTDEGNLAIAKKVAEGAGGSTLSEVEFTFAITLKDADGAALSGSFAYTYEEYASTAFSRSTDEPTSTETGSLSFNSKGKATITLPAGAWIRIEGIPEDSTYTVKESKLPSGYTCTDSAGTTRSGTIEGESTVSVVYHNAYAASGSWAPSATKYVDDDTSVSGYSFSFVLADSSKDEIETKSNSSKGRVSFSSIAFDQDDAGQTFTYYMWEVDDGAYDDERLVCDSSVWKITLSVTDDGDGTLSFASTSTCGSTTSSSPAFYNYHPADLSITKTVKNVTSANAEVEFTLAVELLEAKDGTALSGSFEYTVFDADGGELYSGTIENAGTIVLAQGQTATIYDLPPGSYYRVSENSIPAGFTLTSSVNAAGTLVRGENAATLKNTYSASVEVPVSVAKELSGKELEAGAFSFVLTDENGTVLQTAANGADGMVAFQALRFTQTDDGQTYYYVVREDVPTGATENEDGSFTYKGVTYDSAVLRVEVSLADNGDGTMSYELDYAEQAEDGSYTASDGIFANEYHAEGTWTPTAYKVMETGTLASYYETYGELFSFTCTTPDGESETVECDEDGVATFGAITFTEVDDGVTSVYTVVEEVPAGAVDAGDGTAALDGVIYTTATVTYQVTPHDDGDGTMSFDVTVSNTDSTYASTPVFANSLEAGALQVNKYVTTTDEVSLYQAFTFLVHIWGTDVDEELVEALEAAGFTRVSLSSALATGQ